MILELEKENYVTKLLEQHPSITSIEKYVEPHKSFSFSPISRNVDLKEISIFKQNKINIKWKYSFYDN